MGLFGTRKVAQSHSDARVFADLDALIAEPVAFRFNGETHLIKPVSTKEFFKLTNALARLDELRNAKTVKKDELVEAYSALISGACDTIGRKEVETMTQAQVGALFQLILDCITGKIYARDEEKKN